MTGLAKKSLSLSDRAVGGAGGAGRGVTAYARWRPARRRR
jgi:hypothetical protein